MILMAWSEAQKAYAKSDKGRAARLKYQQSEAGKASRAKYLAKRKEAKKLALDPVQVKKAVKGKR